MFRPMEKLIELLNEYQYGMFVYEDDLLLLRIGSHVKVGGETFVISKKFGFIKWLVENEKIKPLRKFIGWETDEDEPYIQFDLVDQYIAYLSIQDKPIEDLISYLK